MHRDSCTIPYIPYKTVKFCAKNERETQLSILSFHTLLHSISGLLIMSAISMFTGRGRFYTSDSGTADVRVLSSIYWKW